MASKWELITQGIGRQGRGAGDPYHTVTVRVERHPSLGLRIRAEEEWGSDQGSYDEPHGRIGPISAFGGTYAEARAELVALAREAGIHFALLLEALDDAETSL